MVVGRCKFVGLVPAQRFEIISLVNYCVEEGQGEVGKAQVGGHFGAGGQVVLGGRVEALGRMEADPFYGLEDYLVAVLQKTEVQVVRCGSRNP
jgi:hypothetical protein